MGNSTSLWKYVRIIRTYFRNVTLSSLADKGSICSVINFSNAEGASLQILVFTYLMLQMQLKRVSVSILISG